MDRQLFALSLGFLACILLTDRAFGQEAPQCGRRDAIVAQLARTWGESLRAQGLAGNRALVELFASDATGSFTIVASLPGGQSCMVASGDHFELIAAEPPGDPA